MKPSVSSNSEPREFEPLGITINLESLQEQVFLNVRELNWSGSQSSELINREILRQGFKI